MAEHTEQMQGIGVLLLLGQDLLIPLGGRQNVLHGSNYFCDVEEGTSAQRPYSVGPGSVAGRNTSVLGPISYTRSCPCCDRKNGDKCKAIVSSASGLLGTKVAPHSACRAKGLLGACS